MRYDTPVFFQSVKPGKLNPETHNYDDDVINEEKRFANVTDTGAQQLQLIYGALKQGSLTIRLQRPFTEPFSRVRVGNTVYKVDFSRRGKNFVVSEVQ